MGRKGQSIKMKNRYNLSSQQELHETVDRLLKISTSISNQKETIKIEEYKEMFEVINKIKNLEKSNDSKNNYERDSQEKLSAFSDWLKENGANFEKCSIAQFPGYDLGLKANVNIPQGSLFVSIPKKIMMTVESATKSIMRNLIEKDPILRNMPNITLAIHLLVEKFSEKSFFKPYIDILPRTYSTVLYFSYEELQELKGSPTLHLALNQIRNIARQYAYFHSIFVNADNPVSKLLRPHFTLEEYCWAVSTVMTRQNTIPSENGMNGISALIPLWDLLNHTEGEISTDYNPELKRSECLALRNFQEGEQLFIFYGSRSNAEFFIHNGFLPENNENDYYIIKLGVSKSDPHHKDRIELLTKSNLKSTEEFRIKTGNKPFDDKLMNFIRIFSMEKDDLKFWLDAYKNEDLIPEDVLRSNFKVDSIENNKNYVEKSWKFMHTRLNLLLKSYKTTLEDDKFLKKDELSQNVKLAVKMRISEKKILENALQWIETKCF